MTYAPQHIKDLAAYWVSQGGVNSGIVGSMTTHCKGYHLGHDRIYGSCACKPGGVCRPGLRGNDYSVQLTRDKNGLSDAASALDLGKLDGSLAKLYRFSVWLVAQCRKNAPGTAAFREIIYSDDGKRVLRWDRQRGYSSAPRTGEADNSHLWHTHISFYRDVKTDLRPVFYPYFGSAAPVEVNAMPAISSYLPGHVAVVQVDDGANIRSEPKLSATLLRTVAPDQSEHWTIVGWVKGDTYAGSDQWIVRWSNGKWEYTHKANVRSVTAPVVEDTTPFSQADLDAAVAAVKAELAAAKAERDAVLADVSTAVEAIARLTAR